MAIFLVVKVIDVTEQPLDKAAVSATVSGSDLKLAPAGTAGLFKIGMPMGTANFSVNAVLKGLFPVTQKLVLASGVFFPTLAFDGPQEINVRSLALHASGADFNVEIIIVMGMLRDASAQVAASEVGPRLQAMPAAKIRRHPTPILNPSGAGPTLVNTNVEDFTPPGKLFFAERIGVPGHVAIYHPDLPVADPAKLEQSPIAYHVFFHPFIPWVDDYPFGKKYLELIARYVLEQTPGFRKAMAHQNTIGGAKSVFIFPVASLNLGMGTLNSQAGMLRLLQEVNFWLQRMLGAPIPSQPIGPVAMSCFSAGARFLSAVFQGKQVPEFQDNLLRHLFILDGVFSGQDGANETARFCKSMVKWHRGGADLRTFRVYTQSGIWFQNLIGALPDAAITQGPAGSREADSPSGTLFLAPLAFWQLTDKTLDFQAVHQLIPAEFMEHAMTNASFAPINTNPDFGTIFMQLFASDGVNALANTAYVIRSDDGVLTLNGTTDAEGRLRHGNVPTNDYTLTIPGIQEKPAALVMLHTTDEPQIRFLA